jgi:hypothetical protein
MMRRCVRGWRAEGESGEMRGLGREPHHVWCIVYVYREPHLLHRHRPAAAEFPERAIPNRVVSFRLLIV